MERMLIALSALIGLASPASSQNWSRWEIETRLIMKIADVQSETTHAGTTWTTTMAAAMVPGSWCEAATPRACLGGRPTTRLTSRTWR